MPGVLWTRFLEAQDYGVKENIVFQDNKTTMLLEKNGKTSSGKRTKHINMRYFFITDQISKGYRGHDVRFLHQAIAGYNVSSFSR